MQLYSVELKCFTTEMINEPVRDKKTTIWVPTRSDTNRPVQSQKMIRG